MAIKIITSTASASSSGSGPAADGAPTHAAAIDLLNQPTWAPSQTVLDPAAADATAVLDPVDEATVLREGGVLYGNADYGAAGNVRASIVAGRYRKGTTNAGTSGICAIPLNGLMARDEWTFSLAMNPGAADASLISSWAFLNIPSGGVQNLNLIFSAGSLFATLQRDERSFVPAGLNNLIQTVMTLVAGDIPASAFTLITVRFKASTGVLTVMLGDGAKTATNSSPAAVTWVDKPWSGDIRVGGTGVILGSSSLLSGSTPGPAGAIISDVVFWRYYKTLNAWDQTRPGPGVTIDATAGLGSWPDTLGGATVQYSDWDRGEAVEETLDPGAARRTAQIQLAADVGLKHVRVAEFNERAIPTVSGGVVTSVNVAPLIAHLDRFLSRGMTLAMHVGFLPTALGGGLGAAAYHKPNAALFGASQATANAQFARYVSLTFTGLQSYYDGLNGAGWFATKLRSLSFWNEPENQFADGVTAFVDLFEATATLWRTDHADLVAIGGTDGGYYPASAATGTSAEAFQRGVIDRAAAVGLPLGSAHVHVYNYTLAYACEQIEGMRAYLASKGFPNTPVLMTETGYLLQAFLNGSGSAIGSILNYEQPQRHVSSWAGAHHLALLKEMLDRGCRVSIFYRLAQAVASAGFDNTSGLMSAQNPPRPWPILGQLGLFLKLRGTRIAVTTTYPHLRGLGTWEASGRVTIVIVSLKGHRRNEAKGFQIAYPAGLPAAFTGKMWRLDKREEKDGRPTLLATFTEANLPLAGELTGEGVLCIQITPVGAAGTAPTTPAPINSVAPLAAAPTGAYTGQTVTSTTGTFTNPLGVFPTYAFQWQRNGVNISGATSPLGYVLQAADVGTSVRCVVTATSDGGTTSANSNVLLAYAAPTTFRTQQLVDNPTSHYRLNETSGTTMTDELGAASGTYIGATLNQATLTTDATDKAVAFAGGSSSRGAVPDATANRFGTGDFAIECLVKTTATSGSILGKYAGAGGAGNEVSAQVISGAAWVSIGGAVISAATINDGNPHQIVIGRRGSVIFILVDGAPPVSNPTTALAAMTLNVASDFSIGMRGALASSGLVGTVDEVAIYQHDVSNARFAAHWAAR